MFLPDVLGLWEALNRSSLAERLPPGLWVANASVLQSATLGECLVPVGKELAKIAAVLVYQAQPSGSAQTGGSSLLLRLAVALLGL